MPATHTILRNFAFGESGEQYKKGEAELPKEAADFAEAAGFAKPLSKPPPAKGGGKK